MIHPKSPILIFQHPINWNDHFIASPDSSYWTIEVVF